MQIQSHQFTSLNNEFYFLHIFVQNVVDLAAETGGNVETTVPGEVRTIYDVVHIGLTDLPSRLPTQSSTLYANNISKFLLSIGEKEHFHINLEDEVVRGSIVLHNGQLLWPPPMLSVSKAPPPPTTQDKKQSESVAKLPVPSPFNDTLRSSLMYTGGMSSLMALGCASPNSAFTSMVTTFGLAGLVGYHTVWGVTPALHSPLMSVSSYINTHPSEECKWITYMFIRHSGNECNFWNHCRWWYLIDGRSIGANKSN